MDLSLIVVAIIFLVITFLAALVGTLIYRQFFRQQSSKTDRQSEDDKVGMNRFGIILMEVMNERGIEGLEELVQRMRQTKRCSETEPSVGLIKAMAEARDRQERPHVDASFWSCLSEALGMPMQEIIDRLMWRYYYYTRARG